MIDNLHPKHFHLFLQIDANAAETQNTKSFALGIMAKRP